MADKIIGLRPDGTLNPETIAAVKEIAGAGAGSVAVTDDGAGTYTVGGTTIKGLTTQGQLPAVAKKYVDDGLAGKANTTHSHAWGEVTGKPTTFAPAPHTHTAADIVGLISAGQLPWANSTDAGIIDPVVFSKIVGATQWNVGGNLVQRSAEGNAKFSDPVTADDAATKNYVDTGLTGKADATHTHDDRYYTEAEVNALLANRPPVLILGPTDPIPAGTPDGTLVARTA